MDVLSASISLVSYKHFVYNIQNFGRRVALGPSCWNYVVVGLKIEQFPEETIVCFRKDTSQLPPEVKWLPIEALPIISFINVPIKWKWASYI